MSRLICMTRAARCGKCPAPCALQGDQVARDVLTAVCPLQSWGSYQENGEPRGLVTVRQLLTTAAHRVAPEEWGPRMWAELHTWAQGAGAGMPADARSAWLAGFARRIPICPCRGHWRDVLAELPPPVGGTAAELFAWTVAAHNAINRLKGKPELALDAAWAATEGGKDLPFAGSI